ncbi:MAG TPA: glycosyl hydrolase family 28 protein [Desulfuromonadaceae bacterium]|nr:glycosyl hydrolase family 28 protein [Desulfuromonadaceae bacterium]
MRTTPFCFALLSAVFVAVGCKSTQTDTVQANAVQASARVEPFTAPNFPTPKFPANTFNVKDFGAVGDGVTNDTPAINAAIEKCNAAGGGTVAFPAGKYGAGSIHLKSNVRLSLDSDAVIFGLPGAFEEPEPNPQFDKFQDFGHSHFHDSLMWGENIENFAIVGGKINGGPAIGHGDPKPGNGDKLITIKVGKNLDFENITHDKGGHFVYLLNDCENITVNHVVIKESRDAIDLMGCRNVQIHDCNFTGCGDDTIGVKSDYALGRRINSANIYVWDSYFESGCNGLQFGSETAGDFQNVNFWNIRIGRAMKAGIGITSGDSAVIDGVNYSNIVIKGAACPIYLLIWDRLRTGEAGAKVGSIKNVHMMNVTITDCAPGRQGPVQTATIFGRDDAHFENITLENVKINYPGGETNAALADIVPKYPKDYSPRSLGPRPAAGFYISHVQGLTLKNVEITFDQPDVRPSMVVSDADGLKFDGVAVQKSATGETLRLDAVKNFTVTASGSLTNREGAAVEKSTE